MSARRARSHARSEREEEQDARLPRLVVDLHRVVVVLALVPMVHEEHEDGLGVKVGLALAVALGRELELQHKVDAVLRGRLPLEAVAKSRWARGRGEAREGKAGEVGQPALLEWDERLSRTGASERRQRTSSGPCPACRAPRRS